MSTAREELIEKIRTMRSQMKKKAERKAELEAQGLIPLDRDHAARVVQEMLNNNSGKSEAFKKAVESALLNRKM